MSIPLRVCAVLWIAATTLSAASPVESPFTVESHSFKTPIRPPALQVPKIYERYESALQNLLQTQTEGDLVAMALNMGWQSAGLTKTQADSLWTAATNAYKRRTPTLQLKKIDGDHFFMLNRREEAFAVVRKFMTPNGQTECEE